MALRDAEGIAAQNLVRVSSIFPPHCKLIPRKEGLKYLNPGEVVFAVVAENSTREAHRLVVSSIGVAIPTDKSTYGYLSEHHSFGETEEQAGEYAEELAAEMLATTLDLEFDPDKSWDEKKEIYRSSNKIVRTANVTQSAVGAKKLATGQQPSRPRSCCSTISDALNEEQPQQAEKAPVFGAFSLARHKALQWSSGEMTQMVNPAQNQNRALN